MKNLKKVLALALVVVMTLALCTMALAADPTYSISVPSDDTHTYEVYQIFTGDLADGVLADIKWGENGKLPTDVNVGDPVDAETLAAITAATGSDFDKLQVIVPYADLNGTPIATVTSDQPYSAAPGYYLIKDIASFEPHTNDDNEIIETETQYLVKVVKDVEILRKAYGVPTSDKVIVEGEDEVDVNEAGIGDTVNYKITATVPEAASAYDYYYFIINDTMDPELTFDASSVVVSVEGVSAPLVANNDYKLYTDVSPKTFEIAMLNAKALAGKTIIVTYTATLNDGATAGDAAQNKENVTYPNNPNFKYEGTQNPDKPGTPNPDSTTPVPTGVTPENIVETYTTKLTVYKVDENGNVLTGAEFTLTGDTNQVKVSNATTFAEAADGTYYKLKNGTYTTDAPVTEDHMEEAASGATAGYVQDNSAEGDGVVIINSEKYRPVTGSETPTHILVKANADLYESTTTKYIKTVTTETYQNSGETVNVRGTVAADGTVSFEGLGAGTYILTESQHPAGYNTIDSISFTVSFDADTKTFSTDNPSIVLNGAAGLETTIVNEKGSTLPETGGIGTTIFYVLGGVLLAGAAILLITKKRMSVKG